MAKTAQATVTVESDSDKQARVDAHVAEKKAKTLQTILTEKNLVNIDNQAASSAVIKKSEDLAIKSTLKSYRELQATAVNWLRHVEKYHDTTVLDTFLARIVAAQISPQKMMEFIIKFAPLNYDMKTKSFKYNPESKKPYDIKGAMEKPWWKTGRPTIPQEWSFEVQFAILMNNAQKHLDKPKPTDKINLALYEKAFKLAKEYEVFKENDSFNDEDEQETSSDDSEEQVVLTQKVA
jgi:hypothetical protein